MITIASTTMNTTIITTTLATVVGVCVEGMSPVLDAHGVAEHEGVQESKSYELQSKLRKGG